MHVWVWNDAAGWCNDCNVDAKQKQARGGHGVHGRAHLHVHVMEATRAQKQMVEGVQAGSE